MTEYLVLGDGATLPGRLAKKKPDLHLLTVGKNRNLRLQADVFRTHLWRDPTARLADLLRLAAFVYGADTRISRGSTKDVFASDWSRSFRMVLPVSDLSFWKQREVKDALAETLQFLTGDEFVFDFVQRPAPRLVQGIFQFKELTGQLPSVNVVVLFSGGIDSLAAVLQALKENQMPLLVSHRPGPVIDHRQKNLVEEIRRRFTSWVFPHVSMWVNRETGKRTIEFTQRSRSFLFTSLGVVTATILGIDDIWLCDNGVVSINLPQSGENVGTFLSRSTHPRYLALSQRLMRLITERPQLTITNTLFDRTKREVMEIIAGSGHPELIQEAVSCSHVEGKTTHQPHCGVCTQCIDRRFASTAAGLEAYDLISRYEKDVFTSPLKEGMQRTHAENYVRFVTKLERLQTPDALFEAFPELYDCLPNDGDVDASARGTRINYIDGFAGPGEYEGGEPGSPLLAIEAAKYHVEHGTLAPNVTINFIFVEANPDYARHLQAKLDALVRPPQFKAGIIQGEFADVIGGRLDALEKESKVLAPTFAFVDPFGFSGIPFDLMARILAQPKCEVFVNIMIEFINRFLEHPNDKVLAHFPTTFGTNEVLNIPKQGGDRAKAILSLYRRQLKSKASLFFASNSPKGFEKMKEAMWSVDKAEGGKFSDFEPGAAEQTSLFQFAALWEEMLARFRGKMVPMADLDRFVIEETDYLPKHARSVLKDKEATSEIKVEVAPGQKRRKSSFPVGKAVIAFPA